MRREELEKEKKQLLIPIAQTKGEISLGLLQGEKEPGTLVRGVSGTIEPWSWGGIMELEDGFYGYGPYFPGVPLDKAIQELPKGHTQDASRAIIDLFLQIARGLQRIYQAKKLQSYVQTDMILIDTSTGDMLLLPRELRNQIYTLKSPEKRMETLVRWSSIRGNDEEALIIQQAALLSYALTGVAPFESDIVREDNCTPLPLNRISLEITMAVATTLDSIMQGNSEYIFHVKWITLLESWAETLFTENQKVPEKRLESWERKQQKRVARHRFLRNHGAKVAIIVLSLGFAIALLWGPVSKALEPPITKDFAPEQVVESLYESISTLDTETIGDLFAPGFSSGYENEITFLYVSNKQAEAVQRTPSIINVNQWIEAGTPEDLPEITRVYGITDLSMERISQKSDQIIILATYVRWELEDLDQSDLPEDQMVRPSSIAYLQEEKITLVPYIKYNTWYIADHTLVSREPTGEVFPSRE